MLMGVKEIQEIIPHRHPFLLIDCIEELPLYHHFVMSRLYLHEEH